MAITIPDDVRQLLDPPNYVHLSTLRADGSPRNWVVWVGLEDDHILVCTSDALWKAKDMRRDSRVAMSVTDLANPYRMAAIQGRVVEVRPDEGCRYMDPISFKYTNAPVLAGSSCCGEGEKSVTSGAPTASGPLKMGGPVTWGGSDRVARQESR